MIILIDKVKTDKIQHPFLINPLSKLSIEGNFSAW